MINVAWATNADLDVIAAMEADIFENPWNHEMLADSYVSPYDHICVAKDADRVIGYAIYATPNEDCELYRIAVAQRMRRSGAGRKLLSHVVNGCKTAGGTSIFLEVRQSNESAIALYKAFGFEAIATRKNYYKNPTEDAVIMKKEEMS